MEGTPFGRYRLVELLGRGGMGEVWRAYDTAIDRTVALKLLLPHFAEDPTFEQRFRREARAAAQLDDPHVVPIFDVGEINGRLFVTMRLINGRDLETVLANGPLQPERAVRIVEHIAAALDAAHRVGLVHRDVKPSNILLGANDFAYLIDFGIARAAGETGLTNTGATIGTWSYMAPERFNTGRIEPSSDIYALTCVLYRCLTGRLPFPGETLEQIAVGHMVTPPPRASALQSHLPAAIDDVLATGLAKTPDDRYRTSTDLATAARATIAATSAPRSSAPLPAAAAPTTPVSQKSYTATTPAPIPPSGQEPPQVGGRRGRARTAVLAAVAVVVVAAVVGAVVVFTTGQRNQTGSVDSLPTSASATARHSGAPVDVVTGTVIYGVAVDNVGNLYFSKSGEPLQKLAAEEGGFGSTPPTTFPAIVDSMGLAADAIGNVFILTPDNKVLELDAGATTPVDRLDNMGFLAGVAVDATGNIYVAEKNLLGSGGDLTVAAPGSTSTTVLIGDLVDPRQVAVDAAGNVYVVDLGAHKVVEFSAGTATDLLTGLDNPWGVVVDSTGTVYVSESQLGTVLALAPGATSATQLATGLYYPGDLAVDSHDNLYVATQSGITELPA